MKTMIFLFSAIATLPALGQDVSFDRALSEMVDTNIDVRVQQTKANASESQVWGARGALSPTVSLIAQQQNAGGSGFSLSNGQNIPAGQVYAAQATWNVFRSGADAASVRAALSDRTFQFSQLDEFRLVAEAKSAQALLDLIENQKAVEIYRRAEANARRFLDIAGERFKKSLLPHEEMDKIALDAANAEARRADAETQFNTTRGNVEALLGHSRVQLDWPWEKKLELDLKELKQAPADAVESRPDMHAAKTSVSTEDYRERNLFRTMFPTIDLNYTQSLEHVPGQSINGWSSTATLTIPLWNGYHDYSNYRVQVETKYAAEARVHQLERTIESDVKSAQDNFRIAFQQYQSRLHNFSIAKHILEQDDARFRIGRSDANDLSLDLTRVTDAEILAIQGIEQAHLAYMNLKHAFGERVQ